jgi:hypothetical protein
MVERFGIQDHSVGIGGTRTQNPTNQGSFSNIGGGWDTTPAARSGSTGGGGWQPYTGPVIDGPYIPHEKSIIVGTILALLFGPFGAIYTSFRAAGALLLLTALAGIARGGNMSALESDAIMDKMWPFAVMATVAWTVYAVRKHNAMVAQKRAEAEEKSSTSSTSSSDGSSSSSSS